MGGTVAIGFENPDGTVSYYLAGDYMLDNVLAEPFRFGTTRYECISKVQNYFSEDLFEEDDSKARVLYMLNGEIVIRHWGGNHEILIRKL